MPSIPVDVVVELLMEFSDAPMYYANVTTPWKLDIGEVELQGETREELRTKLREYLLTLVIQQVEVAK